MLQDVIRRLTSERIPGAKLRHTEFSSVLEMPEIHDDFEELLRRKQKGQA